ncbi:hypothetical protein B0T11DRAFT_299680 [Plectosphaerella cucumerina]|uniref:Uncharacterized protein n=1 Tax=Plectosphaerella cucumerina TaxID=40658 RepID=A0A8K0THS4_9PEZI|nr:hypothetical protein B0T11DRAFT_299680 [Plectosphaerella cucumerina]
MPSSRTSTRMATMGSSSTIASDPRGSQACSRKLDFRRTYLLPKGTLSPAEMRAEKAQEALRFFAYFASDEIKLIAQDAKSYIGERRLASQQERSASPSFGKFLKEEARYIRKDCHLWRAAWKMDKEPSRGKTPARAPPVVKQRPMQAKTCRPKSSRTKVWCQRTEVVVNIGPGSRWEDVDELQIRVHHHPHHNCCCRLTCC